MYTLVIQKTKKTKKKGEVHINANRAVNVSIALPCIPFTHNIYTSIAVGLNLIEEVVKNENLTTNAYVYI